MTCTWETLAPLTPRMVDVLIDLADGLSVKQSAEKRGLSPFTVKTHRAGLMKRLSAVNGAHAVRLGIEGGWINVDDVQPIEKGTK